MSYKNRTVLLALACASCSAIAQTPIDKFTYGTKADSAVLKAQICHLNSADFDGCVSNLLDEAGKSYAEFSKLVKGREKRNLIKAHYISLASQIKGVAPERNELKITYQQRQSELKRRTGEAWMLFDLD